MQRHPGHEKHLCKMVADIEDLEKIKGLVRDPKYICATCGRAAQNKENLCNPVSL